MADNGLVIRRPSYPFRSVVSGRFKPIKPKPYDPWPERFRPFDLHRPETWRKVDSALGWAFLVWDALYEPMRAIERYDVPLRYGVFDRYREISRKVRLKNGKCVTWKPIGRAILIWDWKIGRSDITRSAVTPRRIFGSAGIRHMARYQTFAIVAADMRRMTT